MDKNGRLLILDTIRGIAILAVFLFHALGTSYGFDKLAWNGLWRDFNVQSSFLWLLPLTYGGAGVAIFFSVSGFCIHLSYRKSHTPGFGNFFAKRFFRVYPPYLFALLLFFFLYPWGSLNIDLMRLKQLVTHVLLVHNFDRTTFFGVNPSFWSIAVEWQLYLVYPLLLAIASRIGWKRAMLVCLCVELPIRLCSSIFGHANLSPFVVYTPFAYWLSWSLGAWLAESYLRNERLPFATMPLLPVAIAIVLASMFRPLAPLGFLLWSLATTILIARSLSGNWETPAYPGRERLVNHMRTVGLVSYSFYLVHQPILKLVPRVLNRFMPDTAFHPLVMLALCLALWMPIFWLSRALYETIECSSIAAGKLLMRHAHDSHHPHPTPVVVAPDPMLERAKPRDG